LNEERARIRVLAPAIDAWLRLGRLLEMAPQWGAEWSAIRAVLKDVEHDLRRLRRRVSLLQMLEFGLLFELLNFLTLWELRILPRAADLIERNRDGLRRALGALGEVEALVHLALPLIEQPDFELPEALEEQHPVLRAIAVGHPLLDPGPSVHNPVDLGAATRILVVTGSNMAGKSTYLKSVGCNLVLAGMGAPVCARAFQWTPLSLYTDVNVRDSLDDGKSYFQVEVERVREAIRAARESPFVLVLFDELFRGTNSTERQAASRAILGYLASTGALAVVATHDHALTTLGREGGESGVENRHFQEAISESGMSFDYRLREGPATTRNALRLLELSGYPEVVIRQAHDELE
jgi:DNA mismatch repair ATPase MutS